MTTASSRTADIAQPRPSKQESAHLPLKTIGKELFRQFQRDKVTGIAAQVAYNLVFALPPLLIVAITVAALVDRYTGAPIAENLHNAITQHAPANTQALLDQLVNNAISQVGGAAASFGLAFTVILALWSGSGGIGALIEAFNNAYDVEERRGFVKKKLMTLGLTVLMIVVIIAAFALFVFGRPIGAFIADQVGLGSVFNLVWNIVRWPVAFLLILILLQLLYYLGPNIEQSFRWLSPGTILAGILWVLATLGFRLYVSLSNPGSAYGVAGSVIVLLFFLYVTAIIFIVGAELNAVLERRYDPEMIRYMHAHPEAIPSEARQIVTEEQAQRAAALPGPRTSTAPSDTTGTSREAVPQSESKWRIVTVAASVATFALGALVGRLSRSN